MMTISTSRGLDCGFTGGAPGGGARQRRGGGEARIRAILTTPTEFPAIPLPDYLLPYVARFDAAEVAAG